MTAAVPVLLHPLPFVTVTVKVVGPLLPTEKLMFREPAPAVIVPPLIVHLYTAPSPASGTEAVFPVEL